MSEQANPEPGERAEVKCFKSQYCEALVKAKISEEHTATQGWQDLYGEHREGIRRQQISLADRMKDLSETIRIRLFSEDEEKEVGDIKKAASETRESDTYFQKQIVDPIIAPLHECERVIESARASARNDERSTPLHVRGLIEAMEEAIDAVPKPKFMIASGRLVIT